MKWNSTSVILVICIAIATCLIVSTHKRTWSAQEALDWYRQASAAEKDFFSLFCKEVFCNSPMAYTLFCDKPLSEAMSWSASCEETYFIHRALPLLRKHSQQLNTDHFAIIVEDHPNRTSLYLINKQACVDTIQRNIVLFRKILGNSITPKKLLQNILAKQCTIDATLKHNHALIGILFGFGTENSLLFDRRAQIDKALYSQALPPWKDPYSLKEISLNQNFGFIVQRKRVLYSARCYVQESQKPSPGFQTLEEECRAIETQLKRAPLSCPFELMKTPEMPAFVSNKSSEETQALLNTYKAQSTVVHNIMTDINLPERVLEKFFEPGDVFYDA